MELVDSHLHHFSDVPGPRVFVRVADGKQWLQAAAESGQQFVMRVKGDAARAFRPKSDAQSIRLLALRPRLTREQWLARFNPGACVATAGEQ